MRDPKRIPRMLEALRVYWEAHPDLRLGQIVVNLGHRTDPFYVEDDVMEQALKKPEPRWPRCERCRLPMFDVEHKCPPPIIQPMHGFRPNRGKP